ncbi:anti-sigma-K factor RskA [Fluviicoccus keumensis]|uniref:Anti-sigma-K factor RskA n=1 Tax=Fluviicoccus keumensis TaxID=1435465 RepID=A0A4Q7Z9L9_9GAMM|nr:anti-sigma factor [Fluviicoccus keumensis]RZU47242.1 anti-sigma-K factor RskA [Fluviicoccus keumensis]
MNYQQPELQRRLAAEYVLGTLQGGARVRFEALMAEQPALRRLVQAWEMRLAPLAVQVRPQPLPDTLWPGISRRLGFSESKTPARMPFWAWWAWGGSMTAAFITGLLVWRLWMDPQAALPVYRDLAVLSTDKAEPAWIVRMSADGQTLKLTGLQKTVVPSDRDLELWVVAREKPLSLGVIRRQEQDGELTFTAAQRQRLGEGRILAISLEPRGGSPTGSPTGPVLFTGKMVL